MNDTQTIILVATILFLFAVGWFIGRYVRRKSAKVRINSLENTTNVPIVEAIVSLF